LQLTRIGAGAGDAKLAARAITRCLAGIAALIVARTHERASTLTVELALRFIRQLANAQRCFWSHHATGAQLAIAAVDALLMATLKGTSQGRTAI